MEVKPSSTDVPVRTEPVSAETTRDAYEPPDPNRQPAEAPSVSVSLSQEGVERARAADSAEDTNNATEQNSQEQDTVTEQRYDNPTETLEQLE